MHRQMGCDWSMCQNLNIWDLLEESDRDEADCHRNVASGRRVAGAIRSLVNDRGLQLECARVLHESLFMSVHMYSNETII